MRWEDRFILEGRWEFVQEGREFILHFQDGLTKELILVKRVGKNTNSDTNESFF